MTTSSTAPRPTGAYRWWALLAFAAAVTLAAGVGVLGVSGTTAEYKSLEQPAWAPPSSVFGPVWTVLYAMIAVAGWLAWQKVGFTGPLWLYTAQLALNALWTPLFFGAGRYGLAFVDIVLLWLVLGATVLAFLRIRRAAGLLLVPYLLWTTYAGALNLAIWQLNR
jgi:tryptophan-rich sensory protein